MATRTFTAGALPNQPITNVAGNITVSQVYTASVDATDVLVFDRLKIPHGAIIEEVKVGAVCNTASTTSLSIVFAAGLTYNGATNYLVAFGSATFSASWGTKNMLDLITGATNPWPVTLSLSDDREPRYANFRLLVDAFTGSVTGSRTIIFAAAVTYHMQK